MIDHIWPSLDSEWTQDDLHAYLWQMGITPDPQEIIPQGVKYIQWPQPPLTQADFHLARETVRKLESGAEQIRTLIEAREEAAYREGYSDGQRGNTFPEKPVAGTALARVVEAETKVLREALKFYIGSLSEGMRMFVQDGGETARTALSNSSEPKETK